MMIAPIMEKMEKKYAGKAAVSFRQVCMKTNFS